eukprot:TRINITY_DN4354_c0_g1_i1.p1 TRINITY_DN4354_c0_g1~~TRINITY_DN4354_c0_g1_i1.p1  ORF type:complete len:116 (-),score=36.65 TRINITY_DN4354_c0_g1_i1:26-373(-)
MGKAELGTLLNSLYSMYYKKGFQAEVSFFVDMIFQDADKNLDGSLSFEEFKEAAEQQPFIKKCFRLDRKPLGKRSDDTREQLKAKQEAKMKKKAEALLQNPDEWVIVQNETTTEM